jgi:hypothetical protein
MPAGGTPSNVVLGPGRLYVAPIATVDPTSASAVLPVAWIAIGYTDAGTTVSSAVTSSGIEVAEEIDPIANIITMRTSTVTFAMAEATVGRLALAYGGGAAVLNNGTAFEFPEPDQIVPVKLVWDSDEIPGALNRRWLFRSCMPSGTIAIARQKAPAKATIPVTFNLARSAAGLGAVRVFPNAAGLV